MLHLLPSNAQEFSQWPWAKIEPCYQELYERELDAANVMGWLADWTRLFKLIHETSQRLAVATTVDTTDEEAERRYRTFLDEIYPPSQEWEQKLKEKLLESGVEPAGMEVPLRNMRAEANLFREANLALKTQEVKLSLQYDKIVGGQTVEWDGQEVTIQQLRPVFHQPDRERREAAWKLAAHRQLADRQALNELWVKLLDLRRQMAANAGKEDYRAYRWQEMLRFDYTPEDCLRFHQAIAEVVVPAAERIYERIRQRQGVDRLRPWDLDDDRYPVSVPPLPSYGNAQVLKEKAEAIFREVHPVFGEYFHTMREEGLLDLENRRGKAPGGYCTEFLVAQRPFIFMNAVGIYDDVTTLLHEGGHAFHVFESSQLPFHQQMQVGPEFAEVASMGMELLASPYLSQEKGGYYLAEDAARAQIQHLERSLLFWPYMAVVDAFQNWVYENAEAAREPDRCDAKWAELWGRFMKGVDWTGLEEEKETGWHRKLHIFHIPFYYVEYGLAQLGAMQVWKNALQDQADSVSRYRRALSLGGTVPLPELYQAAGARFAFDARTLGEAVDLTERTIAELERYN